MEQNQAEEQLVLEYVKKLQDVIDVLICVEPKNPTIWDESILRAIRAVNEVKYYLKNQL